MLKLFQNADVFTLTGDPLERIRQALDVARHQVRVGQHEATDYRIEEALGEAEDLLATARAGIADALDTVQADNEVSSEAEHDRQLWLPMYRAA